MLGHADDVRARVRWTAAAPPMRDGEVALRPRSYVPVVNAEDPVPQFIALRGSVAKYDAVKHDFVEHYLPKISGVMFSN